jgi:hypothetical protein
VAFAPSLHPSECVDPDLCGAGGEESPGALAGGGAGCEDIVNQQEFPILYSIRPHDGKSALDIILSLSSTSTLGFRRSDSAQYPLTDAKPKTAPDLPRQQRCLVKASRALPSGMERNRNQHIKLTGIKERSGRLDHQTTQMTGKHRAAAILEQEDCLAHRPACLCVTARRQVGFIQRCSPRHGERRQLLSTRSAQVIRTGFKALRRGEWPAAAGAKRFGNGPNIKPATATDEGPASGIQGLMTHSAWGGKDKVKKGRQ